MKLSEKLQEENPESVVSQKPHEDVQGGTVNIFTPCRGCGMIRNERLPCVEERRGRWKC